MNTDPGDLRGFWGGIDPHPEGDCATWLLRSPQLSPKAQPWQSNVTVTYVISQRAIWFYDSSYMNAYPIAPAEPVESDQSEVAEWLEAFDQIVSEEGPTRAGELLDALSRHARESGVEPPTQLHTPYKNTIPVEQELPYPGDRDMERRVEALIRWNAMAMVHRQNKKDSGIGGHLSTYSSLATLLEVGFNHFFHSTYGDQPGDMIYFQGHAS